jgi:hypothetical protein
VHAELRDLPNVTHAFRVGYVREMEVQTGTGTLGNGIDNVRISICR